jgi:hypothetical protein
MIRRSAVGWCLAACCVGMWAGWLRLRRNGDKMGCVRGQAGQEGWSGVRGEGEGEAEGEGEEEKVGERVVNTG